MLNMKVNMNSNREQSSLRKVVEQKVVEDPLDIGIRITDQNEDLICFCADNPQGFENTPSFKNVEMLDEFELNIKGYVFAANELVFKSKPYPKTLNDVTELDEDISRCNCYMMLEGTCIRLFYFKNKWYITTTRKLNAFNSKWGPDSFGDLFTKMIKEKTKLEIDDFLNTLNKDIKYAFLIGTSKYTRIVSPVYSDVKLLYTLDKNNKPVHLKSFEKWYVKKLPVSSKNEIKEIVENLQFPFSTGYGLYIESKSRTYKIQNTEYQKYAKLRNNFPSVMFAYLNVYFDQEKREEFEKLYEDFSDEFKKYNTEITKIAEDITKKYYRRFAKKEDMVVSKQEHNILYHVHGLYLKNKTPITSANVLEVISELPITNLNKIISERKKQEKFELKARENLV